MKYDAVVFDLLTALIDSWSLWNSVAGSPEAGMVWRRRYLEITYGCGAYRPYETLVREAAHDVGMPERLGEELERRWQELTPWPEAAPVLKRVPVPLAVAGPIVLQVCDALAAAHANNIKTYHNKPFPHEPTSIADLS